MATALPNANINIPYSPFLDENTGRPSQAWLQWLMNPSVISISSGSALGVTSGGTGLTTIPTNGQLLIGNGTGYTLNTLGFGSGISVTNGSGTITIGNTGVLSFSAGTTGLTPSTASTGAVSLAGTLIAANGGTGFSSYAVGDLLYANTTTTLAKLPDVATGNALISGGVNTAPLWGKIGLTTHVSGLLPVANGGTGVATATANTVFSGPTTGAAAAPSFRALVVADIPALTTGSSILYGNGTGGFSNVTIGSGVSFAGGTLSATGTGGTVTSVTGTAPVVSSGGTTPAISMAAASASVNGYLTSTDWNTFNGKQPAGTYVTSVAVVSSNGFAGTSSGGATPSLTLSTSITGLLYGNGTALAAATISSPLAYSAGTLSIPVATSSVNGYLSSTDWTTFNNKGSGTVTSVTGTAPVVSSGGTTPAISMAAATSSVNGYLTSTDWSTFNNKQAVSAPVTKTADFTVAATDLWLINNKSGSTCTVTLPAASSYTGRVLHFQNYQSQTLVSASSNVVPIAGGAAGTSILVASSGDQATLVSDGTNWLMTQYIPNNILLLET